MCQTRFQWIYIMGPNKFFRCNDKVNSNQEDWNGGFHIGPTFHQQNVKENCDGAKRPFPIFAFELEPHSGFLPNSIGRTFCWFKYKNAQCEIQNLKERVGFSHFPFTGGPFCENPATQNREHQNQKCRYQNLVFEFCSSLSLLKFLDLPFNSRPHVEAMWSLITCPLWWCHWFKWQFYRTLLWKIESKT